MKIYSQHLIDIYENIKKFYDEFFFAICAIFYMLFKSVIKNVNSLHLNDLTNHEEFPQVKTKFHILSIPAPNYNKHKRSNEQKHQFHSKPRTDMSFVGCSSYVS
jgi:hypothetical protein